MDPSQPSPQQPSNPQPWGAPPPPPTQPGQHGNPDNATPPADTTAPSQPVFGGQPEQQFGQPAPGPFVSPPQADAQAAGPAPFAGGVQTPSSSSHQTVLMITAIVIVVLLLVGGAAAYFMMGKKSDNKTAGTGTDTSSQQKSGVAANTSDYALVCTGTKMTNAADFTKGTAPYPIALFDKGAGANADNKFTSNSSYLGADFTAKYDEPETVQLVGCLTRSKDATEIKTCELEDSKDKVVKLKLMGAAFNLDVYAAKTGKKIGSTTVDHDTACPFFAAYDPSNPVYYANPDDTALKVAVQTVIQ